MFLYSGKENPMRYGIMYNEDATRMVETVWYETTQERNEALYDLERTGRFTIGGTTSPLGRLVTVHSYALITAEDRDFYVRN